jgi:predicted transglutaminase-like cysteine proteinase
METHGGTAPPIGFVQFCREHRADCVGQFASTPRVALSRAKWDELQSINATVNRIIEPVTDQDLYGVQEYWTYPETNRGDCEDYALLKRKMLMQRGWPAGALLMTVVQDTRNEGHAVLTVLTDRGDLVLDNQNPQVLTWNQTEYRYVKRQSPYDVSRWEAIDDTRTDYMASTR